MSPVLLRLMMASAGLFTVAGFALRLLPAPPPSVTTAPMTVPVSAPDRGSGDSVAPGSYDSIIAISVFSPDRRAPVERFRPPGSNGGPRPQEPVRRVPRNPAEATQRLRLVGVALGPMGAVAIIDTDPATPGAEVFRVGDLIGKARVVEIRENAVVLATPEGRRILTLPPSVRRSP